MYGGRGARQDTHCFFFQRTRGSRGRFGRGWAWASGLSVGGLAGGAGVAGGVALGRRWRGVVALAFGLRGTCVGVAVVLLLLLLCPFSRLSWSTWRVVSLPCLPCLLLPGLLRLAFVLGVFLVGFRPPGSFSDF